MALLRAVDAGEADTFGDEEKKVSLTSTVTPIDIGKIPADKLAAFADEALAYLESESSEARQGEDGETEGD